jgi:hypothetical protein
MTLCKWLALGQGECQKYVTGERPGAAQGPFGRYGSLPPGAGQRRLNYA